MDVTDLNPMLGQSYQFLCAGEHVPSKPMKNRTLFTILSIFSMALFCSRATAQRGTVQQRSLPVSVSEGVVQAGHSDVPHTISYQGVLRNLQGAPLTNGEYRITATIYDADSKRIWRGTYVSQITNGTFNLMLGSGIFLVRLFIN
jgi:hypothetical protein